MADGRPFLVSGIWLAECQERPSHSLGTFHIELLLILTTNLRGGYYWVCFIDEETGQKTKQTNKKTVAPQAQLHHRTVISQPEHMELSLRPCSFYFNMYCARTVTALARMASVDMHN